jgi:hypothetical protein
MQWADWFLIFLEIFVQCLSSVKRKVKPDLEQIVRLT